MKLRLPLIGVLLVFLLGSLIQVSGQTKRSKLDPAFNAFWIKFKAAVARNDKAAVADMTKLPFMMENRDLDRAGFIRRYNSLFTPSVRRCFAREKPIKDQDAYESFVEKRFFSLPR